MQKSISQPIAYGRTAEVYDWEENTILKLYHTWCPAHWVEQESKVAHAISAAGIPSPAVMEIVEVDGRRGIIYERIIGHSMLQDLNMHPLRLFQHAHALADLQVKIHQLSIPGLESYKEGLMHTIKRAPELSDEVRNKALDHLATLPDGDRVCHGDFHPGNVLLSDKGAVVIDWMTARAGNPLADVARTRLLLSIGAKSGRKQVSPLIRLFVDFYNQTYLKSYRRRIPDKNDQLSLWMPVIAAARLDEQIEGEQAALIRMTQEGLDRHELVDKSL